MRFNDKMTDGSKKIEQDQSADGKTQRDFSTAPAHQKIAFLVPGFARDEADSNCIPPLQQYVLTFSRIYPNIEIAVIAFQYPYRSGKYQWNGIDVYACGGAGGGKLFRLRTWLKAVRYFRRIHQQSAVTTIHSYWLVECALVGQYLAGWYKIQHLATIMGQDVRPTNRYLTHLNFSKMTVTCASPKSAQSFREITGYSVAKIIPKGLDIRNINIPEQSLHPDAVGHNSFEENLFPDERQPKGTNPLLSERKIDILGVGSLIPLKNYRLFVNMIKNLSTQFPAIKATIVGGGEEFHLLQKMIADNRLQENVQLVGELPRAWVFDYMRNSKILLHPSTYESQAYVFMEALYCGMQVVCFDIAHAESPQRIHVCKDEAEMLTTLKRLLTQKLDHRPYLLKSMEDTVHEYKQLYTT